MKFRGFIPLHVIEDAAASGYKRIGSLPIPQLILHGSIRVGQKPHESNSQSYDEGRHIILIYEFQIS